MRRIKMFEPQIGSEEINAVVDVLKSRWLAHGPVVEAFEREFAEYIGVRYAAAVSNGTVALVLALKALDVGPGDEVIVPNYTFIATATSVLMVGAKPVLVDVEPDTFNISVEEVQKAITSRTRAVIAVHLFGHPADVKALREICDDRGIHLIEDAAQAHGAEAYGRKVGSWGHVSTFSFYATKNLTTGEGGMVLSDDEQIIRRVKMLRNHGQIAKYVHETLGGNFRMTSFQAALGRAQLRKLDMLNDVRRRNAALLSSIVREIHGVEPPVEKPWARHVYHLYAAKILSSDRDCVADCMKNAGIEVAVHYPVPINKQPLFVKLGYGSLVLPVSEKLSRVELSLPVHPGLSEEDIARVGNALKECVEKCAQG